MQISVGSVSAAKPVHREKNKRISLPAINRLGTELERFTFGIRELNLPAFPVMMLNVLLGFLRIFCAQLLVVPFDSFAGSERDVAEQDRFRQSAGIIKVTGRG